MHQVFLLMFQLYYYTYSKELTLFEYSQSYSDTRCQDGLINNLDTIVFKCEVEYYQKTSLNNLEFQVKKIDEDNFNPWIHFDIKQQCYDNKFIYCESSKDNARIINLRQIASKDFNQATLRVALDNGSSRVILSEEQHFPIISELTDTKLNFLVNGIETKLVNDTCVIHPFEDDSIYIHFVCKSKVSPCVIEIQINKETRYQFNDIAHISLKGKFDNRKQVNVTLKYAACRLDGIVNYVTCTFEIDSRSVEVENNAYLKIIMILITTFIIIILIIPLLIHKRKIIDFCTRRKRKKKRQLDECPVEPTTLLIENSFGGWIYKIKYKDEDDEFITVNQLKLQVMGIYQERNKTRSEETS